MPPLRLRPTCLYVGLLSGVIATAVQARRYSSWVLLLWLVSLLATALHFRLGGRPPADRPRTVDRQDLLTVGALLALFAPIYLLLLYWFPFPINSDEVVIGHVAKGQLDNPAEDLLGISSNYFGVPGTVFNVMGRLAVWLGGLDLANLRLVHAALGWLIIVPAYFFFRLTLSRTSAVVATTILMSNHSLIAISRMISRNNLAALNLVAAFYFLLRGTRNGSRFDLFVGGAIAGLSFYHYAPARMIFFLWLAFLAAAALGRWLGGWRFPWRASAREAALVSAFGFVLSVAPMTAATMRAEPSVYSREQMFIFPEGREHQRRWYGEPSRSAAYLRNVRQGLVMFNSRLQDQAWMYGNPAGGFLDPLTGFLLWAGLVCSAVVVLRRGPQSDGHLLAVITFLSLFVLYLFLMNQAPNYTRLLLVLPLIAFLATVALEAAARFIKRVVARRRPLLEPSWAAALWLLALPVPFWNLRILAAHAHQGHLSGDDIGGTGRYIAQRRERVPYTFYLVSDRRYPYYWWGEDHRERHRFFAGPAQNVGALSPDTFFLQLGPPPFSLLMNRALWEKAGPALRVRYPGLRPHHIRPDGSLVGVEVLQAPRLPR